MRNIMICSTNIETQKMLQEKILSQYNVLLCDEMDELSLKYDLVIIDYDTKSHEVNDRISANNLEKSFVVLEREPMIATGKMLIKHGIKAYGNIQMHQVHLLQLIETVLSDKLWLYPELKASIVKTEGTFSVEAKELLTRLSSKESDVLHLMLDGLTNQAISELMEVSVRTVKSHITHIFQKLHVNDRLSLVLLLKG